MSFFGNLSSFVELLVFSVGQRRKLWCTWLWWWPFGAFKSNTVGKQFLHDHCQSVVPSTQAGLEVGVWWILDSVLFFISPNIYIYISQDLGWLMLRSVKSSCSKKRCPSDVWLLELPLRCRTGNVLLVSCRWPPFWTSPSGIPSSPAPMRCFRPPVHSRGDISKSKSAAGDVTLPTGGKQCYRCWGAWFVRSLFWIKSYKHVQDCRTTDARVPLLYSVRNLMRFYRPADNIQNPRAIKISSKQVLAKEVSLVFPKQCENYANQGGEGTFCRPCTWCPGRATTGRGPESCFLHHISQWSPVVMKR